MGPQTGQAQILHVLLPLRYQAGLKLKDILKRGKIAKRQDQGSKSFALARVVELSASICISNLHRLSGEVIGPFPLLPHCVGHPRACPTPPLRGLMLSDHTPQVLCNRFYEQPDLVGFLFTC